MYAGRAMERADRRTLFYRPHHPYTRGLLASLPGHGRDRRAADARSRALPPSLIRLPGGCPFHPRCPEVFARCATDVPPLRRARAGPLVGVLAAGRHGGPA